MSPILLAYLAFFGISLPDGLLGVAWPSMRISLHQPVGALGLLLPFAVASSMLSSASTGFLLARIGVGRLLAVSIAVSAVALFGQAIAPAFWVVIVTAVVLSAGSGAIDAGLNAHAARRFSARQITWLHAVYGFGAAAGPLLFAAMAVYGLSWRWAFGCVAAVQALLAVAFAATVRAWDAGPPPPASRPGLRVPAPVWLGATVFVIQTGVETGTALWGFVFLTEARDVGFTVAALTASGYWVALLVGRLVLGPVADRVGTRPMLVAGMLGMAGGAALLLLPGAVPVAGILLIGLSAAPMYPLLTLTTAERVGADLADRAVGVQGAASALGSATLPALIGLLIGPFGAGVIAPSLVVLAVLNVAVYVAVTHRRLPGDRRFSG